MGNYQSHTADGKGISDTQLKLARIKLPEDLTGKRVLDMGCNEGFFCNLAKERGAARVVGIDFVKDWLEFAENKYGGKGIEFRHQGWTKLPDGPFDVVLWMSAMHYEPDPAAQMKRIFDVLSPDGMLILECGVLHLPTKEMAYVPRDADSRWYPSLPMLEEFLKDFSVRNVGVSKVTPGDPVPRSVFHCSKRRPSVYLITGPSKAGKTAMAKDILPVASKEVSLDRLVTRIGRAKMCHGEFQKCIQENYDPADLAKIYHNIDKHNFTDAYVQLIAQAVQPSDRIVIIEGYTTELQKTALVKALSAKCNVWDMQRAL